MALAPALCVLPGLLTAKPGLPMVPVALLLLAWSLHQRSLLASFLALLTAAVAEWVRQVYLQEGFLLEWFPSYKGQLWEPFQYVRFKTIEIYELFFAGGRMIEGLNPFKLFNEMIIASIVLSVFGVILSKKVFHALSFTVVLGFIFFARAKCRNSPRSICKKESTVG